MAPFLKKQSNVFSAALLAALGIPLACTAPAESQGSDNCSSGSANGSDLYRSTLYNGYTPRLIEWAGRPWRVNAGSTKIAGLDHSVRISPEGGKIRFEIRDSNNDNSRYDSDGVRRAELSGSLYGDPARLPNGKSLWGGFSFRHQAWNDPDGMRKLQGGVYGQIHIGSTFGGSPAVAFRRSSTGAFRISTRGELDPEGSIRFEAPLSFNASHDLVYNVVLHPRAGRLKVWLDGELVTDVANVSIGHSEAESYWNFGAYFARGISGKVVSEYANHVYPADKSLVERISARPCWPAS